MNKTPASFYGLPSRDDDELRRQPAIRMASARASRRGSLANWAAHGIALYTSAVFLDSLRFKFTNAPKTQIIFSDLDSWAASLGVGGVFSQTGLFSQHVIGVAELVASLLLILTVLRPSHRFLQPLGAALGIAIMSGAISFHLFTPLGINVDGDGGALFLAACGVWAGCIALLVLRVREIGVLSSRIRTFFKPDSR